MHPNIAVFVFSVARIKCALLGTNNAKKIGYRERKRKIERKNKLLAFMPQVQMGKKFIH